MICVINTNSNTCKIYHYKKSPAELTLLKELTHPESRLKSENLTADKPGKYRSDTAGSGGAFTQRTDPKEIEIENFSREIAKEIDLGRVRNDFEKLILIAPPHMTGLLFQHLNKHAKDLIVNHIQKDLQHLKDHELLDFLKMHTKYPD